MSQPAATAPQPLRPGAHEEGEFVDVDLGQQPSAAVASAAEHAAPWGSSVERSGTRSSAACSRVCCGLHAIGRRSIEK